MFGGAVTVTQPVFMGGALVAANKIADINEKMAANTLEMKRQDTLYNIDQVYWQVVSLRHKQTLAESYVELVKKLKDIKVGAELKVRIPALDAETTMKVTSMKDKGSFAVWKATKATGQYDQKTFEVKARPTGAVKDVRPGMSVILKK